MSTATAQTERTVRARRSGHLAARWGARLLVALAVIAVVLLLGDVLMRIVTTDMWFDSVHDGFVYRTILEAKVVLFCVFGAIAGAVGGLTVRAVRRTRPRLDVHPEDDIFRAAFRRHESRVRWLIVALAVVAPGVLVGRRAASHWQTYLLWAHTVPWHDSDPLFHKGIDFFVEVYPFHLVVVSLLSRAVVYGLGIAVIGGYWYGGWRLRGGRRKVTRGTIRLLSALLAAYLLMKAIGFWLARYAVTTSSQGPVTGASYTSVHATLPSKDVLVLVAALCSAVLLANVLVAGRARVLLASVGSLVVVAMVVGSGWPALVHRFQERPSAARVDLGEIAHNRQATLAAFGLDGAVRTVPYAGSKRTSRSALVRLAGRTAQIPLIDPNQMSPTFTVKQQIQPYYGFKPTLDIGRYDVGGRKGRDVALSVRGLDAAGIPDSSWVNDHLVYTHGYGIVAAPTTEMDAKTESPVFLDGGMPPKQQIPVTRPQTYFGRSFGPSSYAIVGQPAGSHENLEFDHPGAKGSATSAHTTYRGHGGIPIGSTLRRALFAARLHSLGILTSSEINKASQLLMVRSPRARVAEVAPWLTLDGDVYPAVVGGHIKWIVDGYTTSSRYPDSQLINLRGATRTTLTADGASVAQPNERINYMRNSVKAVVDAYTGRVTLYAWNQKRQPDPLLQAWESVFPGLVRPQSSISPNLMKQLRYPTDLFNAQRFLLADYHVKRAANFYSGNDFWRVPSDPTVAAAKTLNSSVSSPASSTPAPPQPSDYISMSVDGHGTPHFTLSSPMVTYNGHDLAAFVSVDSQPGPDYGKFTVLDFPSVAGGESPSQVQNDIESDTKITEALTLQRGGQSKVVLGDLTSIPLAGRMLYVEPVYTKSTESGSFPILRHVIALYGNGAPSFDDGLRAAVRDAVG